MASFDWDVLQGKADEGAKEGRVPPGQYTAQVSDATVKITASGKQQVSLLWRVTTGPETGGTVFQNIVLSPENNKAMFMWFQNWEALGVPRQMFRGDFTLEQAAALVRGKNGVIVVEERPNDSDPKNPYCNVKSARITDAQTGTKSTAVEV